MAKSGGFFGKLFRGGNDRNSDINEEPVQPFELSDGTFKLTKVKKAIDDRSKFLRSRDISQEFKSAIEEHNIKRAAELAFESLQMPNAADDVRSLKMVRAVRSRLDGIEDYKELFFLSLDTFPSNTPLARTLCRDIAEGDLLDEFEKYVSEKHAPEEIAKRAEFYGALEANFSKYVIGT